ncbi:MAG: NTP transferase domain-containing protein [Lachnospiraceae bacterium]|nr:NTP transferase domain-containing protein [Lachnospiraceae bacterium]
MEQAIVMASGMGTRMLPLTKKIPKPLVLVHGIPMIETVIAGLKTRGVKDIFVVVGYLGEQFRYLEQKYGVRLIWNHEYETVNNISSVYAAKELLSGGDCFICEADLYVAEKTVFSGEISGSCYFGKMVPGYSDDWVFEQDDSSFITRVGKGGRDCYNMVGVAYFKEKEARLLASYLEEAYRQPGHETWFWDDVVNMHLDTLQLLVRPVESESIIEIDTLAELEAVNRKVFDEWWHE